MSGHFTLHPLTRPVGSRAVSARFDEGTAMFARVQDAYERGEHHTAVKLFLAAATMLNFEGPMPKPLRRDARCPTGMPF